MRCTWSGGEGSRSSSPVSPVALRGWTITSPSRSAIRPSGLATVSRNPEGRLADLLGDVMVVPRSASGDTGDDDRLAFPPDHVHRIGGLHHLDLLGHPLVYARIRGWLEDRPEGGRGSARPTCRRRLSRHSGPECRDRRRVRR